MSPQFISKARSKFIRSLHQSKYRQKYNNYLAEGHKICKEIIISKPAIIDQVVCSKAYYEEHQGWLKNLGDRLVLAESKEMKPISTLKTAAAVLIVVKMTHNSTKDLLNKAGHIIYLDGIQDPGNLGTIIRTADWYGITNIAASQDTVSIYNPKTIQSAMGSHLGVNMTTCTLSELKQLTKLPVMGAVMNGSHPQEINFPAKVIIVIGNEGKGIRAQNLAQLDLKLTLPGAPDKIAESLNAAISMGIICQILS